MQSQLLRSWKLGLYHVTWSPHCGLGAMELVEHKFINCQLAQQEWFYATNIIWQLSTKRWNPVTWKSFSMIQFFYLSITQQISRTF